MTEQMIQAIVPVVSAYGLQGYSVGGRNGNGGNHLSHDWVFSNKI